MVAAGMRARLVALLPLALIGSLALAAPAAATTFCVAAPSCVEAGGTAEPGLEAALLAARPVNGSPGPDAVVVGPGTYAGPFSYLDSDVLTITGAGSGQTVLATSADNAITLLLYGNAGDLVRGLSVRASGENATALGLGTGTADGVVAESLGASGRGAVDLGGGTLSHSTASAEATDKFNSHVVRTEGTATISDSALSGATGVLEVGPGGSMVQRTRIDATGFGIYCYTVHCAVRDTLIELSGGTGEGVVVQCFDAAHSAGASVRNATFQGAAYADVTAACGASPASALALVDSSIMRGADHALGASGTGGEVDPSYDDYDPATDVTLGGATIAADGTSIDADPLFLDPGAGDYRPRSGSPLVDAGNPAALGVDESATDLAGAPRVVGGRRDIGAFEYQPPALPGDQPPGSPSAGTAPPSVPTDTPLAGGVPPSAPRCNVAAPRRQRGFASSDDLKTIVGCSAAATVRETAVARLRLGEGRAARRLTLRLGSVTAALPAGRRTTLSIRPRVDVHRRLVAAARHCARVTLSLRLAITDADGNRSRAARTIRRLAL
jgi:hypothetical protein